MIRMIDKSSDSVSLRSATVAKRNARTYPDAPFPESTPPYLPLCLEIRLALDRCHPFRPWGDGIRDNRSCGAYLSNNVRRFSSELWPSADGDFSPPWCSSRHPTPRGFPGSAGAFISSRPPRPSRRLAFISRRAASLYTANSGIHLDKRNAPPAPFPTPGSCVGTIHSPA